MSVITKLTTAKSRDKKINIYLDGKYAFSLPAKDVARAGLRTHQEIAESQVAELAAADKYRRCYNAALGFVSYKPRSEYEVRQKLRQRRFDNAGIEKAITSLKDQGLIDDESFARFWKENRQDCSPRSRWLTGLELKRKGIEDDLVARTVEDVDDEENAYLAAVTKVRKTALDDYDLFHRKLGDFLRRRGFHYNVIQQTVEKLWSERGENSLRKYKEEK
jgi:regulatory protein